MNPLLTRVISAIVALAILISVFYFWGHQGVHFLIFSGVLLSSLELSRLFFPSANSQSQSGVGILFVLFVLLTFSFSFRTPLHSTLIFTLLSVLFCLVTLFMNSTVSSLEQLFSIQTRGILGLFYLGLLPLSIDALVNFSKEGSWFFTLLAIVFAGDIGGYVFGRLLGKRKLMPLISPQKTIAGALGGLLFSVFAGLVAQKLWLPYVPPLALAALSLACGVVAQLGDLFESLIKRVAAVKDSGTIMPGHGGFLDRIDGLLFAGPVLLWGALFLENTL